MKYVVLVLNAHQSKLLVVIERFEQKFPFLRAKLNGLSTMSHTTAPGETAKGLTLTIRQPTSALPVNQLALLKENYYLLSQRVS